MAAEKLQKDTPVCLCVRNHFAVTPDPPQRITFRKKSRRDGSMNWAQNQRRWQPALSYQWCASVKVPPMEKCHFFNILYMTAASRRDPNMQSSEGFCCVSRIHQWYFKINDFDTVGNCDWNWLYFWFYLNGEVNNNINMSIYMGACWLMTVQKIGSMPFVCRQTS